MSIGVFPETVHENRSCAGTGDDTVLVWLTTTSTRMSNDFWGGGNGYVGLDRAQCSRDMTGDDVIGGIEH